MQRPFPVLALLSIVSLTACAPDGPASVATGLGAERALADLDEAEIEQACDGWVAYATATLAEVDGPNGAICAISSALGSMDSAECETRYAACIAEAAPIATLCESSSHPVPSCDRAVTVALYESCTTISLDSLAGLGIDCSLAGRDDEIDARLDTWILPDECASLQTRECAPFAPNEP